MLLQCSVLVGHGERCITETGAGKQQSASVLKKKAVLHTSDVVIRGWNMGLL